jgi:hypothetical protein
LTNAIARVAAPQRMVIVDKRFRAPIFLRRMLDGNSKMMSTIQYITLHFPKGRVSIAQEERGGGGRRGLQGTKKTKVAIEYRSPTFLIVHVTKNNKA